PCERCAGGRFHHAISNRCVRDSYLVSTLRAFVSYTWKWSRIFERAVDIFVAPSRFMRDKLVEHGFDARRIVHLPYLFALPPEEALPEPVAGAYALYFGRLVASKGIETLIEAWKGLPATFPIPLKIAGTGPMEAGLREWIARAGITQIECLGHLTGKELERVVEGCRFVVYPSEWYENFPLVTYETYLAGKPILVSDRGGMPEMVDPGSTGLIFRAGDRDDLRQKILTLGSLDDAAVVEMGRNARMKLIEEYHPDRLYPRLMAIYEQAGEVRKTRKR
ncbi:MAG: glycosyltransferase, partial [Deltaproteobacteria bacterium]